MGSDAATPVPFAALHFRPDSLCGGTCNNPGGSADPGRAFTDGSGEITVNWTLGQTAGSNRLEALIAPEAFGAVGVWATGN